KGRERRGICCLINSSQDKTWSSFISQDFGLPEKEDKKAFKASLKDFGKTKISDSCGILDP
ncbi:MAG: hypothetical protein AAB116_22660, partial [Candidatus Poribacteria bacterium]